MSGGAEATKTAEGGKEGVRKIPGVELVESMSKGFWKRIKAVAGGAWKATGEQVTGELGEVAERMGFEGAVKEKGVLSRIASISESVAKEVDKVLGKIAGPIGGVVAWPVGLPFRFVGRALRGIDDVVLGAITGNAPNAGKKSGGEAASGGEAVPHPA
ncbi:MAG: hypothetical protein AAB739_04180 [Patescibacteria group bacterium]